MNKNAALLIAGIIFDVVSLMHLLRIWLTVKITIADYVVPMWTSWVGFIVAFILSLVMFMVRRRVT